MERYSQIREMVYSSRVSFEKDITQVTTRRLSKPEETEKINYSAGYLELLPRFEGLNFVEWIRKNYRETGKQVKILDIGCGSGFALIDLRKLFPFEQLSITGIGNRKDIEVNKKDYPRGIYNTKTEETLSKLNINFLHQNFIDSYRSFEPGSFDIITAVHSLDNIRYPQVSVLKKVWRLLKFNGIAFMRPFFLELVDSNIFSFHSSSALEYLKDTCNLDLEIGNSAELSIRKTQDSFPNIFEPSLRDFNKVCLKREK